MKVYFLPFKSQLQQFCSSPLACKVSGSRVGSAETSFLHLCLVLLSPGSQPGPFHGDGRGASGHTYGLFKFISSSSFCWSKGVIWPCSCVGGCGEQIMRRLWGLDVSKARCSSAAFPKMFISRPRLAQLRPQMRKMQSSCFS
jgi:hypothetical protein